MQTANEDLDVQIKPNQAVNCIDIEVRVEKQIPKRDLQNLGRCEIGGASLASS